MPRSLYSERDYAFGQVMLTLRTTIGLTQGGLAARLGVSRHAVAQWEGGNSYPKVEHLKHLVELGLRASAFPAGCEAEEIGLLWRAAHQKVLLDQQWLRELLGRSSASLIGSAIPPFPGAEQGSVAPSNEIALWTVPFARNTHFTGRDELLDRLTAQLAFPTAGQPTAIRRAALTQAQVIKGLGGIGKTQTAVEYAYRAREQGRYTHILWIAAASEEAIMMSFSRLAELLPGFSSSGKTDQHTLVATVIRWLEECPEPWLLILDNADDLSVAQPYLPLRGNGSVLLTTRASAAGWLAPSLEVDALGVIEGAHLLLRRAGRFEGASDEEINEAATLAVELAQFPLALDQAGAYIEETGCSLADYRELYRTHRSAMLARRGKQATGYPDSVATTWSLSFAQVERANPAATELLQLCAFLAPDHIPEELLTKGAPQWPPALQAAAADRFRFNQLLEVLLTFSLVKRLAEERLFSLHRLVQVVQRERLSPEEHRAWAERLVRALQAVFPQEAQEATSWPVCQRYLDQVQACDALIREQQVLLPEAADLLERAGTFLRERGMYLQALPLFQHALHLWEQQLPPDPVGRARSLHHLATLYNVQGKYAEAEPLYQEAIGILEQEGRSEPDLLVRLLRNLANLYNNRGAYAQADPLYRRALQLLEQQEGPEHPQVMGVLTGWAWGQTQQGRYTEAERLARRALRLSEQQWGPEHPQVVYALLGLALIHTKQREYAQAEALYLRALHIREEHLGPEHPLVAMVLHTLAKLYTEQKLFTQAERLLQRALEIREEQVGLESQDVGDSLRALADLYTQRGEYTRAEPLFQRALRIREQEFGLNSAPVAEVVLGLARLSFQQGAGAQAAGCFQRALEILEQQYGEMHLETAEALEAFARFQQAQGNTQEAAFLYQRALAVHETVLGSAHPRTLATREGLQAVLEMLSQTREVAPGEAPHEETEATTA